MSFENPIYKTPEQDGEELEVKFKQSLSEMKQNGASIAESAGAIEGTNFDDEQKKQIMALADDIKTTERRMKMLREGSSQ